MFERYTSKLLLSSKTSIGTYVFDVYTSIEHNLTSTITSHPTQYGAPISDHKFEQPDELTFEIGMSDASQDLVIGQFYKKGSGANVVSEIKDIFTSSSGVKDKLTAVKEQLSNFLSDSRSVNAFNRLNQLKINGEILSCVTRLKTYNNMIIQSINVHDDVETKYGLRATVTLREVLMATLQTVQVNSTAQVVQTTSKGTVNALDFDLTSKRVFSSTDYDEYGLGDF